jgi:uridine kinase
MRYINLRDYAEFWSEFKEYFNQYYFSLNQAQAVVEICKEHFNLEVQVAPQNKKWVVSMDEKNYLYFTLRYT